MLLHRESLFHLVDWMIIVSFSLHCQSIIPRPWTLHPINNNNKKKRKTSLRSYQNIMATETTENKMNPLLPLQQNKLQVFLVFHHLARHHSPMTSMTLHHPWEACPFQRDHPEEPAWKDSAKFPQMLLLRYTKLPKLCHLWQSQTNTNQSRLHPTVAVRQRLRLMIAIKTMHTGSSWHPRHTILPYAAFDAEHKNGTISSNPLSPI